MLAGKKKESRMWGFLFIPVGGRQINMYRPMVAVPTSINESGLGLLLAGKNSANAVAGAS